MSRIKPIVAALENRYTDSTLFFELYARPYYGVIRRELKLARLRAGETVLVVGCGALPFTTVLAARMYDIEVHAIDCDPTAVSNARCLIDRLGLSARVKVSHADASRDALPPANAALVALQAAPKDAILRNLKQSITGDSGRALFRLARSGLEAEYGSLTIPEGARFVRHRMPTFDRSVLISVAGNSEWAA